MTIINSFPSNTVYKARNLGCLLTRDHCEKQRWGIYNTNTSTTCKSILPLFIFKPLLPLPLLLPSPHMPTCLQHKDGNSLAPVFTFVKINSQNWSIQRVRTTVAAKETVREQKYSDGLTASQLTEKHCCIPSLKPVIMLLLCYVSSQFYSSATIMGSKTLC